MARGSRNLEKEKVAFGAREHQGIVRQLDQVDRGADAPLPAPFGHYFSGQRFPRIQSALVLLRQKVRSAPRPYGAIILLRRLTFRNRHRGEAERRNKAIAPYKRGLSDAVELARDEFKSP